MFDDGGHGSADLGREGSSKPGLLVVVPGSSVEKLGLGLPPKR
jgi:hypothetical protein